MTTGPIPLFVNPIAGRGRAGKKLAFLRNLFEANDIDYDLTRSVAPGDIESRVLQSVSGGARQVIVAGGDGSVHEAVNGIMRSGEPAALGVIPIGTGNDFAKACAVSPHWEDAAILLADRIRSETPVHYVDVGRMNDRFFANGVGIGFDAKVNAIARGLRLPIGDLVYLVAVFQAMWDGVITPQMSIRYGGNTYEGPMTLANVSNGEWVGGMFNIAPGAKNDDGMLDLVCAGPVSRMRILMLLPKLIQGTHIGEPEITRNAVRNCEIVAASPVPSHLDGEVQPLQTRFRIEVLQRALRLL